MKSSWVHPTSVMIDGDPEGTTPVRVNVVPERDASGRLTGETRIDSIIRQDTGDHIRIQRLPINPRRDPPFVGAFAGTYEEEKPETKEVDENEVYRVKKFHVDVSSPPLHLTISLFPIHILILVAF